MDVLSCHEALLGHAIADVGGPGDTTGRVVATLSTGLLAIRDVIARYYTDADRGIAGAIAGVFGGVSIGVSEPRDPFVPWIGRPSAPARSA